ncbi:unnamed protein product [Schistocephalus solidus]|uniref:Pecanex-like protein n=1 Tax=Schistocephalus solidus TaxID=70667 RepID=A0A183TK34_SCHSO|nr:unnamed protein product [Schistocephalus solidus]
MVKKSSPVACRKVSVVENVSPVEPAAPVNVSHCAWSRLVLLGSFLCTAMVDGLCFSFGLHVLHIVQEAVFTPAAEKELSLPIYLIPGALVTGMHLYASKLDLNAMLS